MDRGLQVRQLLKLFMHQVVLLVGLYLEVHVQVDHALLEQQLLAITKQLVQVDLFQLVGLLQLEQPLI